MKVTKNLCAILLSSLIFSCSVEVPEEENDDLFESEIMKGPYTQEDSYNDEKDDYEEEKTDKDFGLCAFDEHPEMGCLKLAIGLSELVIGHLSFPLGVKEFSRTFPDNLADELEEGESLEFVQKITQRNFYSKFFVALGGNHSTYSAYHQGLGNLVVNNVIPGYYELQIARSFTLKILDEDYDIVGYKCAVIWATEYLEIFEGEETHADRAFSEFELRVFDEGCNGERI